MPVGKHLTQKQKDFIVDSRNKGLSGDRIARTMGISRKTVYNTIWKERKKGVEVDRFKAPGYKVKKKAKKKPAKKYYTINVTDDVRNLVNALATEYNCTANDAIHLLFADRELNKDLREQIHLCHKQRQQDMIERATLRGALKGRGFWAKIKDAFTI